MNNIEFGFIVLHYIDEKMTIQSVNQLLSIFYSSKIKIIIVDNGSPNESGKHLLNYYNKNTVVDVILNKKNEGFARGNNIGYKYLVNVYQPNFVVIMNNDVLIKQGDFLNLITKAYDRTGFGVLGPDIYCPRTKLHQNPSRIYELSRNQIEDEINLREKMNKNFAFYYYRHLTLGKIKRLILKNSTPQIDRLNEKEGVVLHGACYIFSNQFMKKRDYAFNPSTFLYFEEDILYIECKFKQIKMVYAPSLKVEHLEDVSTNSAFKSNYKKAKMKNNEMLKSIKVLASLIN